MGFSRRLEHRRLRGGPANRRNGEEGNRVRIGELLGLRWEDVDLDAETLRVRRTRSQAKTGPAFTRPKNGKAGSYGLRNGQ